jgi:hypothetical protein
MTALVDLAEPFPDEWLPPRDRATAPPTPWGDNGFVHLPGFFTRKELAGYVAEFQAAWPEPASPGWQYATPYMHHPELRRLCCHGDLAAVLEYLIGEPMAVHLNLTGWTSTTRNWHQDGYLNPDPVADWYAAVWVALEDVHPDSGPFQYVPGSHRLFPPIRREKMLAALGETAANPNWPTESERILTPLFEQLIVNEGLTVETYLPKAGDVFVWHARLLHRGSSPSDPSRERRALISHYSAVNHRRDMPEAVQHPAGGWFFPIAERLADGVVL